MKWEPITLMKEVAGDADALGNAAKTLEPVLVSKARFTPPRDENTALEGRDVTRDIQRFTIPVRSDLIPAFSHLKFRDKVFKVEEVVSLTPRWTVVKAVIYETGITGR